MEKITSLHINLIKLEDYNQPTLLTFKVISNKFSPLVLQKNYVNQGFITSNNSYQYYLLYGNF
jgi:hypothetical protein